MSLCIKSKASTFYLWTKKEKRETSTISELKNPKPYMNNPLFLLLLHDFYSISRLWILYSCFPYVCGWQHCKCSRKNLASIICLQCDLSNWKKKKKARLEFAKLPPRFGQLIKMKGNGAGEWNWFCVNGSMMFNTQVDIFSLF